jgi:peptide/nickel transport system substrate-binding protein
MPRLAAYSAPRVFSMNKERHVSSSTGQWFALLILCVVAISPVDTMAEPRGEIRVVENWRPDRTVFAHNILQTLFEYALDRNEIVPCLGVSWKWISDTVLEVELREGVHFSNGEMFDAHAVEFNLAYQREHNPHRYVQEYLRNLKEIRVLDPHIVQIVLAQPDALLLQKLLYLQIGAPSYTKQVGWKQFLKKPIGTGPYELEGEVRNYRKAREGEVYAVLRVNPTYWKKGLPRIKKIEFVQHSPQSALRALIEERVDLVTSLIPKDTLKVEESPHSKVVKGRQDVRYTAGFLNLMSPHTLPLRTLRVREALNYAVDREELIRYAFKGNAIKMRGVLTEKSGVDLSDTDPYEWNIPKARELLKEAGYGEGFKMKLFYHDKDYLTAHLLKRFYSLLNIEVEIKAVKWEWFERHLVYPNTREGYSWEDEEWWMIIFSDPANIPELMGGMLEWNFHSGAPWQTYPDWLGVPLDKMYRDVFQTQDRDKRFEIYKKVNEYIADQALWVFTVTPFGLYGVNEEVNFVPQVSQYLYLDYSSVTENHWSMRGKSN